MEIVLLFVLFWMRHELLHGTLVLLPLLRLVQVFQVRLGVQSYEEQQKAVYAGGSGNFRQGGSESTSGYFPTIGEDETQFMSRLGK